MRVEGSECGVIQVSHLHSGDLDAADVVPVRVLQLLAERGQVVQKHRLVRGGRRW